MARFVFYGGKGGVGKTTVASAYALKCAGDGLRTLVVSTDPAHSTSDVFGQQFGDEASAVDGRENLWAMEIDPDEEVDRHLQSVKRRMGDQVSPAIVNAIDRQVELAHRTPGAHEAALFDRFIEVMREAEGRDPPGGAGGEPSSAGTGGVADAGARSEGFDRVVFDTSPTGGTLRLLALPEFLDEWLDRLIQKRAKSIDLYEKAAIGEKEARRKLEDDAIIEHLQRRKERFEFAGDILREDAVFYLVLNPDELSIRETARAIEELAGQGLGVDGLVINKVTPSPDDDEDGRGARYLRRRVEVERDRIARIRSEFDPQVRATIEARVEEVTGDRLLSVAEELGIDVRPEPAA